MRLNKICGYNQIFFWITVSTLALGCQESDTRCSLTVEAQSDSTAYINGAGFEGVIFTRNRDLGTWSNSEGDSVEVDLLQFLGINGSYVFFKVSEEDVCKFEEVFGNWLTHSKSLELGAQNEIAKTFDKTSHLVRQYIGYQSGEEKKIRVAFMDPDFANTLNSWKEEPVGVTGGWPYYFEITYDLKAGDIQLGSQSIQ